MAGVLLPAAVVLGWIGLWGGLMPPVYRDIHSRGWNLSSILSALSLSSIWGGVVLVSCAGWAGHVRGVLRSPSFRAASVAVLALWIVQPSSFDVDAGRWGGPIWQLVQRAPQFGHRSLVLLPMAVAGVLVVGVLLARSQAAGRLEQGRLLVLSLGMLLLANAANSQAWERYADPGLLLMLGLLVACGERVDPGRASSRTGLGLALLGAVQLGMTSFMILWPVWQRAGSVAGGAE
jgi:hypothetical protein